MNKLDAASHGQVKQSAAEIYETWRQAPAEQLLFPDNSFDRVVSQFALMFFADCAAGVEEMARVARPGGTIPIATWASIELSPGYAAMVDLLQRLFDDNGQVRFPAPALIATAPALRDMQGRDV